MRQFDILTNCNEVKKWENIQKQKRKNLKEQKEEKRDAMEEEFFYITGSDKQEIKLLHAVIWLSLTTYAWQDYDSVCGAFYNGLYYLEDVL